MIQDSEGVANALQFFWRNKQGSFTDCVIVESGRKSGRKSDCRPRGTRNGAISTFDAAKRVAAG